MMNLSSRKKGMLLTISSNLLLQFVTVVCGFILPPLIIGRFGSAMNGMVSSIKQFIAYLNIVEAGVGGAAIAAMYKPLANKDIESQNGILSASCRFYNKSGLLFVVLVVCLAIVYPLIIKSEIAGSTAGLMVLVLGITGAAEFFLIGKYRVLLTADRSLYVISFVQAGAIVFNTAVSVVLIQWGFDLIMVNLMSSLVFLSRYFVLSLYIKRKYPQTDFHAVPDYEAVGQSKNVLVHQIGGLVVFNSPLVLLTFFCSLKDVSIYSIYAMVFNGVGSILSSFCNGLQAFFGDLLLKDELIRTNEMYSKFETVFYIVVSWMYSMTYILIMPFMEIYTVGMSDANYIQPILALLLVLSGLANQLRKPCDLIIIAAGHYKQTQWHSILEVVINVIASIYFTIHYGIVGVVLGSLCSYAYRTFDIIFYANKKLLKRRVEFSLGKITIILGFFILFLYFISYINYFRIDSVSRWIIYAIILGIVLGVPACIMLYVVQRFRKIK